MISIITTPLCAAGPLLHAAAQLIRHFPAFRDIVVSVARKTDAQMWPALFAAVGSPSNLLESLLDVGALQSAACCLLIVDRIQGAEEAHGLALRLIKVSEIRNWLQALHGMGTLQTATLQAWLPASCELQSGVYRV